jgi:hypothetical protein
MSNKNTAPVHKKRGRPPKTEIKSKPIILEQPKETEELVLYLPLTDKQNDFTINDTEYSQSRITTNKESSDELSEDIQDSVEVTANNDDINKLINEIKKRDIIIKNLKDNLKNFKSCQQDNILNINKNTKKTLINLGLITLNDNKLVVAETSKYACWWCCHNFDTYPIFLPEKYVNNKYHVFGNFCSFSCVLAYNETLNDYRKHIREGLIRKLYKDIFNIECEIKPAGPKEILEKFGGPISIDNYRDPKTITTKNFNITIPPQIPLLSYFEELNISNN